MNYITIIASLLIFLFPYIGKIRFSRASLSSTVISLGVLGTFSGIFAGLLEFDVSHLEAALPQLLEGLKTAFLTSIAGMCASLILRLYPRFYGIKAETAEETETESEATQMISILSSIDKNIAAANRESSQSLELLSESLNAFGREISELSKNAVSAPAGFAADSSISGEITQMLKELNDSVRGLENVQSTNTEQIRTLCQNIQMSLESLNQVAGNIGLFLNKSVSLSFKQQESVTTQMNNLGSLVKNTGEQFERQIINMEEKLKYEMSAMEQFSRTLLTIINKLTIDHNTLMKRQQEEN